MVRKKPAISHQPPSFSGGKCRAVFRRRRLEREPGQLADELDRIPVHRGPHVEADDLDGDEAEDERGDAEVAEIDRPDLRVADFAEPDRRKNGLAGSRVRLPIRERRSICGATHLDLREDILILGHEFVSLVLAPDRKIEPPVPPLGPAARPERPADDDADRAPEDRRQRQEKPEPMDAERADRVADDVAEERVFMFGRLDVSPLAGLVADRISPPCSASARAS